MSDARRPNILVFLTDDHGQWALPTYGNREIIAPNIDYLASSGARMSNAFTPCPVCSPARASFFTGRLPSQHGVHDWLRESEQALTHPGIDDQTNIAELLQDAGYHTGLVGKWHAARSAEPKRGFDRWFSYQVAQYPHFGEQNFSDQGEHVQRTGHQSTLLTDEAVDFLRDRPDDQPFFLFVGYVNTHTPHTQQPERLVAHYRNATFDDIPDEQPAAHRSGRRKMPTRDALREEWAQYYASVTMIDDQVGRLLDELDAQEEMANTLVIYTGDHGHMNGHHGLFNKGNGTVPQNFIEESIRIPCVMAWHDRIPAGQSADEMVDLCDVYATVLDAAGVDVPSDAQDEIDSPGASFLPLLTSGETEWKDTQFCEYGNARMARTASHKLVMRYPGPNGTFPNELYDLESDPRERLNCYEDAAYTEVRADLAAKLKAHFARYEIAERSGADIMNQPMCNPNEPWRAEL
jgi:choline-sulfatase